MNAVKPGIAAGIIAGLLSMASVSTAASPVRLSGSLIGAVKDSAGLPQMGATVYLFNGYDKLILKALTDVKGGFVFESLLPDAYSVRVTLSSFMPAMRRNILIQPGMQSVLAINLASVLSSIELVYNTPTPGSLMNDDWKWALRSSMSTRPVLRILPKIDISDPAQHRTAISSAFSETQGIVRVASGESSPYTSISNQPDLGTTFALATSFYGSNRIQVAGNVGYGGASDLPTAGIRTSYSRSDIAGPEVKLTMQQISLPTRGGYSVVGGQQNSNVPALRTMSITVIDRAEIADGIQLDYGASLDSVTFFDRLNYVSPFARLTYRIGDIGQFALGYSSGAPPVDLLSHGSGETGEGLQQDMAALSVLPRVSMRDGQASVQRSQNYELSYRVTVGSRTYTLGAYREAIRNAALTVSAPDAFFSSTDLLPELSSNSYVFNIGNYNRMGYMAAVTQDIAENYHVTVAYGNGGVLRTDSRELQSEDPDELRSRIHRGRRQWAMAKLSGTTPVTGTRFVTSYQWTDYRSLTPGHIYMTNGGFADAGLNVRVHQPIPAFGLVPGRLEATAELRNLLAQGYLPVAFASGKRGLLTHSPRALRGGVSFIF